MEIEFVIALARITRRKMMPEQIENSMVEDWWWDEIEYGVPSHKRLKRQREIYDEEEMQEEEN